MQKAPKAKKRMEDYGYKAVMIYILEGEYEALREYCYRNRLSHSGFVRDLIVDKLQKEGMLKKSAK